MKKTLLIILTTLTTLAYGQDKYNYVHYNKLTEIKGTEFVIATIEIMGKLFTTNNKYLLFINTKNGTTKQIDFPKDAYIEKMEQIKIDSLGINKVIVAANIVNLDNSKSIDWADPTQIIILSPDGQEKIQLTEDNFFVRTWTINSQTGTIVVTGHYDSNNNGKYDKTDKNEILIYDLKTLKLTNRI
jgi:hypothetical protein